jgi:hypothetical protein
MVPWLNDVGDVPWPEPRLPPPPPEFWPIGTAGSVQLCVDDDDDDGDDDGIA